MAYRDNTLFTMTNKGMIGAGVNTVTGGAGATSTAATLHTSSGKITTASSTAAVDTAHTVTLTNNLIEANDIVLASVTTSGTGIPVISTVTPAAGSCVIVVQNVSASAAFNAALVVSFLVIKVG